VPGSAGVGEQPGPAPGEAGSTAVEPCFGSARSVIIGPNRARDSPGPAREIENAVNEAGDSTEDETAYLLRSPANRERLLKAIDNVAHGRDLEVVDPDDLA